MQSIHRISHEASSILSVAVSDKYIFAGTQGHVITVHDLKTFQHVADLVGHNGSVLSLTLSPDNSKLFSSSGDSIVKVWCTASFKCLNILYSSYDVGDIFSTAYSARHDTLYLGSQNTSLQWVKFGLERPTPSRDSFPTRRPNKFFDSTGPSGRSAQPPGTRTRRGSSVHDTESGTLIEIGKDDVIQYAHYSYVFCLLIGQYAAEEVLFSGGGDAAINIWSLTGGQPHQVRSLCQSQGASILSLTQHESLLYAGQSKGTISIWDLETNQLLRRLQAHDADVQSLSISRHLLASVGGTQVKLWDLAGGVELVDTQSAHKGTTLCSAVSSSGPDVRILVTGGNDNDVAIWQLQQSAVPKMQSETSAMSNLTVESETSDEFMVALRKLVSYRSISNSEDHMEDCRRAASYLRRLASDLGAEATLVPTAHNPIVLIKFQAQDAKSSEAARSILYYGHYDVISANEEAWSQSPWTLTGRNGYLYGRGVSDNKAPVLSALFAAHELLQTQSLAVNLTFLIEGEEESGSRGFREAIKQCRESGQIGRIDEVFLSNSYWLDDRVPCLTYGLRGVIHASVKISNTLPDIHSGVEGGSVREPTIDLVNLLATLTHDTGAIALPNFYDPVRAIDDYERRFYEEIANSQLDNPGSSTRLNHNTAKTSTLKGTTGKEKTLSDRDEIVEDLMNRWCRPSLTIHKISVSGPGNSTIIPHAASANISMRIVPDQTLAIIKSTFIQHLTEQFAKFKSCNELTIKIENSSDWWVSPPTSLQFTRLAHLIHEAWSIPPLIIREGGSIPMVRWLEQEFSATAVHFPMGQSSDCAHLVDERLRILNIVKGREIIKNYFAL